MNQYTTSDDHAATLRLGEEGERLGQGNERGSSQVSVKVEESVREKDVYIIQPVGAAGCTVA